MQKNIQVFRERIIRKFDLFEATERHNACSKVLERIVHFKMEEDHKLANEIFNFIIKQNDDLQPTQTLLSRLKAYAIRDDKLKEYAQRLHNSFIWPEAVRIAKKLRALCPDRQFSFKIMAQ